MITRRKRNDSLRTTRLIRDNELNDSIITTKRRPNVSFLITKRGRNHSFMTTKHERNDPFMTTKRERFDVVHGNESTTFTTVESWPELMAKYLSGCEVSRPTDCIMRLRSDGRFVNLLLVVTRINVIPSNILTIDVVDRSWVFGVVSSFKSHRSPIKYFFSM